MSENMKFTRCGSRHPHWSDPVTHCTRLHGHDGQHGYAGVYWVDEPEQARVEPAPAAAAGWLRWQGGCGGQSESAPF